MWSLDDWRYVARTLVIDPKGREWSVALMDLLGQDGDPDLPNQWLELQFASGRFFTLIYLGSPGALAGLFDGRAEGSARREGQPWRIALLQSARRASRVLSLLHTLLLDFDDISP